MCKSFVDDYKQVNGKISGSVYLYPMSDDIIQSFVTKDNKYIIVLSNITGYNVYDMINGEWLFNDDFSKYIPTDGSCCKINFEIKMHTESVQSLFLNDEMIIISQQHYLSFYYIPTKDLKSLTLIKKYQFKTENLNYCYHGMCCIGLKHSTDEKNEMNHFSIKILLLGGETNKDFFKSLLIVEIGISMPFYQTKALAFGKANNYNHEKIYDNDYNVGVEVVKETLVDSEKLMNNYYKGINSKSSDDDRKPLVYQTFGCICLRNTFWTAEPIVLLLGGDGSLVNPSKMTDGILSTAFVVDDVKSYSLFILNVSKCQLKKIENVCDVRVYAEFVE